MLRIKAEYEGKPSHLPCCRSFRMNPPRGWEKRRWIPYSPQGQTKACCITEQKQYNMRLIRYNLYETHAYDTIYTTQ